jgi:hypothetical protein
MNRTSRRTSITVNTSAITRLAVHIEVFPAGGADTFTLVALRGGVVVFVG